MVRASRAFGNWRQFVTGNAPTRSSSLAVVVGVATMIGHLYRSHQKRRQKRLANGVDSISPRRKRLDGLFLMTCCCFCSAALDSLLEAGCVVDASRRAAVGAGGRRPGEHGVFVAALPSPQSDGRQPKAPIADLEPRCAANNDNNGGAARARLTPPPGDERRAVGLRRPARPRARRLTGGLSLWVAAGDDGRVFSSDPLQNNSRVGETRHVAIGAPRR